MINCELKIIKIVLKFYQKSSKIPTKPFTSIIINKNFAIFSKNFFFFSFLFLLLCYSSSLSLSLATHELQTLVRAFFFGIFFIITRCRLMSVFSSLFVLLLWVILPHLFECCVKFK